MKLLWRGVRVVGAAALMVSVMGCQTTGPTQHEEVPSEEPRGEEVPAQDARVRDAQAEAVPGAEGDVGMPLMERLEPYVASTVAGSEALQAFWGEAQASVERGEEVRVMTWSDDPTSGEREAWHLWMEGEFFPWWVGRYEGVNLASEAIAADEGHRAMDRVVVGQLVALTLIDRDIAMLQALDMGPPVGGSCDGTLVEQLHGLLEMGRVATQQCLVVAPQLEEPLRSVVGVCEERLAYYEQVLEGSESGVCEVYIDPF